MTMTRSVHPEGAAPPASHAIRRMLRVALVCLAYGLASALPAQETLQTGPQELVFAGLRAVANQGQINAVHTDAQGNI